MKNYVKNEAEYNDIEIDENAIKQAYSELKKTKKTAYKCKFARKCGY